MKPIYSRLKTAGLPRAYVKKLLPFWWEDRYASNRIAYLQGLGYIAKHIGIPFRQLIDQAAEIHPTDTAAAAFKRRNNTELSDFTWPKAIAITAAQFAVTCLPFPYKPPADLDPIAIRESILRRGDPWVSLSGLLSFCWDHGIPVLHLSLFPAGNKKMEGLAVYTESGPAIILTSGRKQDAWISFHLAHELGHILCGHVSGKDYMDDDAIRLGDEEKQEQEANDFAVALLTGKKDFVVGGKDRIRAERLARAAKVHGASLHVDPGVLLLNYAYNEFVKTGDQDVWRYVGQALNVWSPGDNAPDTIRQMMQQRLDLPNLPDDTAAFLLRLCSIDPETVGI